MKTLSTILCDLLHVVGVSAQTTKTNVACFSATCTKHVMAVALLIATLGIATSCNSDAKLSAAVEQASATLPKSLDDDGITTWNSVAYDKETNVLTFEYIYNSEYVTEDAFAATDADMKAALINYIRQDAIFMKAMQDCKPDVVFVLKLSGKDSKKEIKLSNAEI